MARFHGRTGGMCAAAVIAASVLAAAPVGAQSLPTDPPGAPAPAPAQPRPAPAPRAARQWAIAIRGGLAISTNSGSGMSQLPATLSAIANVPSSVFTAPRAVSSWFFGDGTAQLNQATLVFGIARMSPLDTVLESPGVKYGPTGSLGVTLTRDLTPRWAVNVNVDVDLRSNALSAVDDSTVEEVRSAFVTSWQGLLDGLGATAPTVTATRTGATSSGRQIDTTATLTYQLGRQVSKTRPFVEFGGGIATMTGGSLSATLVGDYAASFLIPTITTPTQIATVPFHQTDTVTVHWQNGGTQPAGVFGAGIEHTFSATRGLRAQVRFVVGSNNEHTTLDVTPSSATLSPPDAVGIFTHGGSIIVSNTSQLPNSLSGPALTGFKTFSPSGMRIESTLSLSYYVRF